MGIVHLIVRMLSIWLMPGIGCLSVPLTVPLAVRPRASSSLISSFDSAHSPLFGLVVLLVWTLTSLPHPVVSACLVACPVALITQQQ